MSNTSGTNTGTQGAIENGVHKAEDVAAEILHIGDKNDIRLQLRHKLQIYGFWTILILALGGFLGQKYCAQQNKKFFEIATTQGSFYIDGKDGKGHVYDLTERPVAPTVVTPPTGEAPAAKKGK
jgi:hypothetical protein